MLTASAAHSFTPTNHATAWEGHPTMKTTNLELEIYQIADDATMRANRTDGTGWEWCWADWRRDWMDNTPSRFAYRCLPLTIANQIGLWVKNPVTFTALWHGGDSPGSVEFFFKTSAEVWKGWITDQFGTGIITWNTPFLFRTRPEGSRLLISGPANYFKANAQPLTALIESDWMTASFTMNWKVITPGVPVLFEAGEPLFQALPLGVNICNALEGAVVSYGKLAENPEIAALYHEWSAQRQQFQQGKAEGRVAPDAWQKEYFQGRDPLGRAVAPAHTTRIQPPKVRTTVEGA
jgi:hypothetical protein